LKVEPALAEQVTFASELEMFHSVTAQCVGLLVTELEAACEPGLQAMLKVAWAAVEQVRTGCALPVPCKPVPDHFHRLGTSPSTSPS
jgi:hypothetical protein